MGQTSILSIFVGVGVYSISSNSFFFGDSLFVDSLIGDSFFVEMTDSHCLVDGNVYECNFGGLLVFLVHTFFVHVFYEH